MESAADLTMEEDDPCLLDVHFCLTCQSTVIGLDNYVEHRKTRCAAQKTTAAVKGGRAEERVGTHTVDTGQTPGRPNGVVVENLPDLEQCQALLQLAQQTYHLPSATNGPTVSPLKHAQSVSRQAINNEDSNRRSPRKKRPTLKSVENAANEETEKTGDFFLSLELQSKGGQKDDSSTDPGKHPGDKELPISNILGNLNFSSEEEAEDESDDDSSEEGDRDGDWLPSSSHTGGKWRPGQRPGPRSHPHPSHTGGKWKPGQSPTQPKRKRGRPPKSGKERLILSEEELEDLDDVDMNSAGFACDECPETFATIEAYAQHIAAGHDWNDSTMEREVDPNEAHVTTTASGEQELEEGQVIVQKNASEEPPLQDHSVHVCTICEKMYYNKYGMARHITTPFHRRKAFNHPDRFKIIEQYQKPLLYLSPYQCMICRYFFNNVDRYDDHLVSAAHVNKVSKLICPIVCILCNFISKDKEGEMLEHCRSKEHIDMVSNTDKPCILKKKVDCELSCQYCQSKWKSYYLLKRHLETRHPEGQPARAIIRGKGRTRPRCPFCHTVCHSVAALTIHVRRRHTKQRPFRCIPCNMTFCDKHTLQIHTRSNRHKRNVSVASFTPAVAGVEKGPRITRSYQCPLCDFVAPNFRALRPHHLKEHMNETIKCLACNKDFMSSKGLEIHQRATGHSNNPHVDGDPVALRCTTCGKTFQDAKWFQFHAVSHTHLFSETDLYEKYQGQDKTSIKFKDYLKSIEFVGRTDVLPCPEPGCDKKVIKQHIVEHLRIHANDRVFQCPYCEQGFYAASVLKKHIHKHLGLTYRKCETCSKEFWKVSTYKKHLLTHDEYLRNQHVCSMCGMAFTVLECLRVHERRHGEKTHICTHPGCRQKFVFKSELTEHSRIHTGEKPFLCDLCGYKARTKNHMLRHSRTHTGERKYHCEYCTYKASNKTHLRRHMRIHIGSKPYKCPYCIYSCNTHENIRKHITKTKKHEGLKIYPCKFCDFGSNNAKEFSNHMEDYHLQQLKDENLDVSSVIAGIYDKKVDVAKPLEGSLILPVKERKRHFPPLRRTKPGKGLVVKFWEGADQNDSDQKFLTLDASPSPEDDYNSVHSSSVIQYSSGVEERWTGSPENTLPHVPTSKGDSTLINMQPYSLHTEPTSPVELSYTTRQPSESVYGQPSISPSQVGVSGYRELTPSQSIMYGHHGLYKFPMSHHSAFTPGTRDGYTTAPSSHGNVMYTSPTNDILYPRDRHLAYAEIDAHNKIINLGHQRSENGRPIPPTETGEIPLVAVSVDIY